MRKLIDYFIKHPFAGNVLMVLILLMGFMGLSNLRSTLMPQINPGFIIISAAYPGASPEEIEKGIIDKIENSLKSISGIDMIRSRSRENAGEVNIEIATGFNEDTVLQDVKNAVDGITSFPSGMEPPNVRKLEFTETAVRIALTGGSDLRFLKEEARRIEDDLRMIDGISKIELSGFPPEEIEIALRENDLQRLDMTLDEAYRAVENANIDITGGTLRGTSENLRIRAKQKKYSADGLRDIILRTTPSGGIIYLNDVADVADKWSEEPDKQFVNGKPAIIFTVFQTNREDIIKIARTIHDYTRKYNSRHNLKKDTERMILDVFDDRSVDISSMRDILQDNGIIGFILVIVFLSFALNFRLSFWVAVSIPLAFMGTFMIGSLFGITINRLSLFGMILVVGILVDDGIVIAESIYQHHEDGKSPLKAAIDGTMEVLPAVFSAVLTTIVAFTAFFFLDGLLGQLFVQMAFVVIAALLFSLIESALILPSHIAHSRALQENRKTSRIEKGFSITIVKLRENVFSPALKFALSNKLLTLTVPVALLIITIGGFAGGIIRSGDANSEDISYAIVDIEMPPGTVESETMAVLDRIEKAAVKAGKAFDSRHTTPMKTARLTATTITAANKGSVAVILHNTSKRNFHSQEYSNAIRKEVGEVPRAERINYVQMSHFGKPVSISILSHDLDQLNKAKERLKNELYDLKGLKNILDDNQSGMREISVTLKQKAYLLGLDLQTVMTLVRQGVFGYEVQRLHRGHDEVKVFVRLARSDRSNIGNLENMRIRLADGRQIPLKEIANLRFEQNLETIRHIKGRRQITVEADMADDGVPMAVIQKEIKQRILPELKKNFPSISFHFGGRDERLEKTVRSAKIVIPVIIILLLSVIIFTFGSIARTFLVFLLVPFGIIGVGWGHAIHGLPLDMPSTFGIVALIGIMINDAIVLISTVSRLEKKNMPFKDAVFSAAISRFRPILLTSLTTIAGLAPLIVTNNSEAHIVIPMAISVAYGLLVSTLLTLFILPVLLLVAQNIKEYFRRLRFPLASPVPVEVPQKGVRGSV